MIQLIQDWLFIHSSQKVKLKPFSESMKVCKTNKGDAALPKRASHRFWLLHSPAITTCWHSLTYTCFATPSYRLVLGHAALFFWAIPSAAPHWRSLSGGTQPPAPTSAWPVRPASALGWALSVSSPPLLHFLGSSVTTDNYDQQPEWESVTFR